MNREQKAATIDALASELQAAEAIIAVDYRGLSVSAAAELRTKLRQADASFRVVKNSLTERAASQAGVEGLTHLLEGPTALTFVHGDAALAAKTIAEQARATQLLPFKGGVMGVHELAPEQLTALSRLPTREVLYGQLVGVVASPVNGLVRTLNALISGLAVALGQVHQQKESEAPAAAEPAAAEPAAEEPAAEEPAEQAEAEAPDAEEQPTAGEPAAEETAPEETAAEAPAAEEQPATPEAEATEQAEEAGVSQDGEDGNQAEAEGAQAEGADAEASETTKEN
jgi:large subunit ribosomal protein L10